MALLNQRNPEMPYCRVGACLQLKLRTKFALRCDCREPPTALVFHDLIHGRKNIRGSMNSIFKELSYLSRLIALERPLLQNVQRSGDNSRASRAKRQNIEEFRKS